MFNFVCINDSSKKTQNMKKLIYLICLLFSTGAIAQTWQQVAVPTTKNLNCIVFSSPQVGYIGGADSLLLKTIDGGITWNEVPYTGISFLPGGEDFMELDFVTDDIGFATIGPYTGSYRTADGGLTWTQLTTSMSMCYNHGLYFSADGHGFVGGSGCFQGEQMAMFTSGTATPATINTPSWSASDMIVDIDFDQNSFMAIGLAVSTGGRILRTTDGGFNWDTIASPLGNQVPLTSVTITNSNLAYIGYDNGFGIAGLLMSTDGGLTWGFDTNTSTFYYPIFHDVYTTPLGIVYTGTTSTTLNAGLIMEFDNSTVWNMYPVDEPIYSMTSNDTVVWGAGKNGYLVRKGSPILSINDLKSQEKITLFPNPTSDFVTVQFSEEFEQGDFTIEVYSIDGKLVKSVETETNRVQISDLNSGNYIVRIIKNTMVWNSKLLKL